MRWKYLAGAMLLAAGVVGCQQGQKEPAERVQAVAQAEQKKQEAAGGQVEVASGDASAVYHREVDAICNAEVRSGASERPEGERSLVVAMWLGENVTTPEGRKLLAEIARLPPPDKVALLDREAAGAGLGACAMARTWSGGPTPPQIPAPAPQR
jgi:hypothetical protein